MKCGFEANEWLKGDKFDAVMNYIFAKHTINFFGSNSENLKNFTHDEFIVEPINAQQFGKRIDEMMKLYNKQVTYSPIKPF